MKKKLITTIATNKFINSFNFGNENNYPNDKQYDILIKHANEQKKEVSFDNIDKLEEYDTIIEELKMLKNKNAVSVLTL